MPKAKKVISILAPMYNESENINILVDSILAVMDKLDYEYELICVNDGSSDDSFEKLKEKRKKNKKIKIINFSRNFGKENALKAAIDYCSGDAAICIDADLQEPPEVIPQMIKKWEEGFNCVYAVRNSRKSDSWLKKNSARVFYRIYNKLANVKIPEDTGDFRLFDRKTIDVLKNMNEHTRFNKGLFAWVGFSQTFVKFDRKERNEGNSKFNYIKLMDFALDGITSFSYLPLRVWSVVGLIIMAFSFLYGFCTIFSSLLFGSEVTAASWVIILLTLFGGLQFIALGVIGEYLGRLFIEAKNRPLYIIDGLVGLKEK